MAVVKGQNLRVFIGGKSIAAALECSLSLQMNVNQISTKDDEGSWVKNHVVSLAWSVRANGVVTDETGRNDVPSLLDRIGQTVRVQLALAGGTQNSEISNAIVAGDAIISDVQITSENRKRGLFDITLTGKKNMLFDLRMLITSDGHCLRTSDGHILFAPHEA